MQALLLCVPVQTSWQQCCATAFTPIKIGYPHRCAITKHQWRCRTLQGRMQALWLCVAVQTSWQQCCATAFAPIKFGSPHRCVFTKHQCSAALFRARCMPCGSVLSTQSCPHKLAHKHCNHQTPVQCSTLQGKMHALWLCAAVKTSWQQLLCHCIYTYQA